MYPDEPITGCTHGGATDPSLRGLSKREWLIGKALAGAMAAGLAPGDAANEAIVAADLVISALQAELDAVPLEAEAPQPAPLTPSQM